MHLHNVLALGSLGYCFLWSNKLCFLLWYQMVYLNLPCLKLNFIFVSINKLLVLTRLLDRRTSSVLLLPTQCSHLKRWPLSARGSHSLDPSGPVDTARPRGTCWSPSSWGDILLCSSSSRTCPSPSHHPLPLRPVSKWQPPPAWPRPWGWSLAGLSPWDPRRNKTGVDSQGPSFPLRN